jgi:predicted phage terminase large subunit-like protein
VQSWAQAQSKTFRDNVYDWYKGTFRTRIWEGGSIVLIMTRWHEDDLAGRLLRDDPGAWTVLHYKAISDGGSDPLKREEGEPLSPTRYSLGELRSIQDDVGQAVWMAEYQGMPTPPEGTFFDVEAVDYLEGESIADYEGIVRYWDLAATEAKMGRDPDFTVGFLMAKSRNEYFCIDAIRGRWSPAQVETKVFETALRDRTRFAEKLKVRIEEEPGAAGKSLVSHYKDLLAGFDVDGARATGNKMVRAQPFATQVANHRIKVVVGNWNMPFIDEMRYFPVGAHDDMIDAASGAFNELAIGPKWKVMEFFHLGMSKKAEAS